MYKYLIVLSILVVVVYTAPQTRKRSSEQRKCANESVFENCIQQLFVIGSSEKHFPNTNQQITEFCGKLKEADTCVKDYTKRCMTATGRRATEVAVAGIARLAKRMCKSPAKREEFVKNAECGNAVIGDMRSCLSSYRLALHGAVKAPLSGKLPILCCKFHEFRGCVRNGFDKVGAQVCPNEARAYYAKIADSFQSDVFDLICNDYDDGSDNCKNVDVPEVTPSARTRSLFAPLRQVIKSIIEDNDQQ